MCNLIFHQQCIAAQWIVIRRTGGCMTCDCKSFLTIFQSYLDDGRVMMQYCVQWNSVYKGKDLYLRWGSNTGPLLSRPERNLLSYCGSSDKVNFDIFFLFTGENICLAETSLMRVTAYIYGGILKTIHKLSLLSLLLPNRLLLSYAEVCCVVSPQINQSTSTGNINYSSICTV